MLEPKGMHFNFTHTHTHTHMCSKGKRKQLFFEFLTVALYILSHFNPYQKVIA